MFLFRINAVIFSFFLTFVYSHIYTLKLPSPTTVWPVVAEQLEEHQSGVDASLLAFLTFRANLLNW